MGLLDWSWPEVMEASEPDITMDKSVGLEGPNGRWNYYGPGCSPCGGWRTSDPSCCPTPPLSLG